MTLEELKNEIEQLSFKNQILVLKFFVEKKIKVSENKSGSFINMTVLPLEVVEELEDLVSSFKEI